MKESKACRNRMIRSICQEKHNNGSISFPDRFKSNGLLSEFKEMKSVISPSRENMQLFNYIPVASIQRKTTIFSQKGQTYNYGTGKVEVGDVVEVGLDPQDMHQGQSANLNAGQNDMMTAIRTKWGISGGDVVKGHLWNDNLGGSALNINLYPITKAANSDHLGYVENKAKECIARQIPIYYKVEVDTKPDITEPIAEFDCEIRQWNPVSGNLGNLLIEPVTVFSDLRTVHAYNEAYETYTGNDANRQKRPRLPKWLKPPKTRIGELTRQELWVRTHQ